MGGRNDGSSGDKKRRRKGQARRPLCREHRVYKCQICKDKPKR